MKLATLFEDGWELDDGAKVHKEHPRTLYMLLVWVWDLLRAGSIVKLMFRIGLRDDLGREYEEVERMWVIVERRLSAKKYLGVLDNDPYCTKSISSGMRVVFEPRHVIQIRRNES